MFETLQYLRRQGPTRSFRSLGYLVPLSLSVLDTFGLCGKRRVPTPTSSGSLAVLVGEQTAAPVPALSLPWKSRRQLGQKVLPLWGCPKSILLNNGLEFCSKFSVVFLKRGRMRKITMSAYHPHGNGAAERVDHTTAQMLAMVANERRDDWGSYLPHMEFACNSSGFQRRRGIRPESGPRESPAAHFR